MTVEVLDESGAGLDLDALERLGAFGVDRGGRAPRGGGSPMTVEVLDESGAGLDLDALERLAAFVMDRMRLHPQAEMCLLLVDEATIAPHHPRGGGAARAAAARA